MAAFKVLLTLALAATAFAVPMPRPSVVEATVQEITDSGEVCVVDGVEYERGASVPTGSNCEMCVCLPPGFACTRVQCERRPDITGCRLRASSRSSCCPQYQCPCLYNGETFEDGSRIEDPADLCTVRFCVDGTVRSTPLQCFVRDDCEPRHLPDRCCPSYDHCTGLGKFPQGSAEPYQPEEEVPVVIQATTAEEVEEAKAVVQEVVESVDQEVIEEAAEAAEDAAEAVEEAVEEAAEAAEEAAEEEAKAEAEEEEEAVAEEEGSGLVADESDEAVEADDAEEVEVDVSADGTFAAQLQLDEAAFEASGVAADDDAAEDVEGSGFVANFARTADLRAPIEASGDVAEDEAEAAAFDGSGDATVFAGAASERLRLALEGSGEVAFDEAEAEAVEGSGRRVSLDVAASEPLLFDASGDVALDESEGSGAQEPELVLEGEDLLTSK